jgi:ABC-type cobalamin/Fe3+-siderophores transport systems, ATPase components
MPVDSEESERLAWALEQVDLKGLIRHDYWSLSGGQRQRALVARALARRPRLLIMDEPTGGLDLAVATKLMECLGRLNREEAMTILCVSHDLASAAYYGTHITLVCDGGVTTSPPSELVKAGTIKKVYGVSIPTGSDHTLAQAAGKE